MSRAFVTDKEDWVYCPKAGERCMHAAQDKECTETACEHFGKDAQTAGKPSAAVKVVRKTPKEKEDANTAANAAAAKASKPAARATKKSKLQKPKKWGGRSGGFWVLP